MIFRYLVGFSFLIGVLIFSSCVQNKKVLYLQTENELKADFPTDTVLREYNMGDYQYKIQPEDILSIRFETLTEDEYNIFDNQASGVQGGGGQNFALNGYLVDRNGFISLPELGKVKVSGLAVHELEEKLELAARAYVDQPVVKIFILNYRVTVIGEVNSEGVFTTTNNRISILEAIANAGGLSDMADRSKVKVIRQQDGKASVFYVDLLHEETMRQSSFFTHQNDIIVVPPLKQRPFRRYFGQNLSLFISTVSVILLTANLISE
ncbi:MAG: polysaccharide biosynthesis/export family protein [Bacteroidota bacterium]